MECSLRVEYMSFIVFCKFEIVILKIVLVMTENIPFAFLYVLSIAKCFHNFDFVTSIVVQRSIPEPWL